MRVNEREFWVGLRQGLLMILDALERWLKIEPTTSEIRKAHKRGSK